MPSSTPRLVALGSIDIDAAELATDPVWLAAGRLAVTTAADTLTVVRLEPGLPVVAVTAFPEGMRLPTDPWDNFDLNYDRVGIHGLALRPDGEAFAIGGVTRKHDRAVYVFALDGAVLASALAIDAAEYGVPEDFMLCPIALAWSASGATLLMCCSIENEHHIASLDPAKKLSVCGLVNLGGDFPEPAIVAPISHPTAEAAAFQIACGQDGVWLRVVEHGKDGLVRIETELDEDVATTSLFGFAPDGGALYSGTMEFEPEGPAQWHRRGWPTLAADAAVTVGGFCHGGVVLGVHVGVVVAATDLPHDRWPRPEQRLELYRREDGGAAGSVPFPVGHVLVGGEGDIIITREANTVTAWRIEHD